jgi:odorant receptor
MQAFTLVIPMTLEIFLPCFFGSKLSFASSRLSSALFGSEWIETDKEFKTLMKMFMENTKVDTKISAFGVFQVNLVTFTKILNSAYSLFAAIKTINTK